MTHTYDRERLLALRCRSLDERVAHLAKQLDAARLIMAHQRRQLERAGRVRR